MDDLVNTSVLGGWVRASVGALLAVSIAKWPALGDIIGQETQVTIGVAVSGIVVGLWSHYAKSAAKSIQDKQGDTKWQ